MTGKQRQQVRVDYFFTINLDFQKLVI